MLPRSGHIDNVVALLANHPTDNVPVSQTLDKHLISKHIQVGLLLALHIRDPVSPMGHRAQSSLVYFTGDKFGGQSDGRENSHQLLLGCLAAGREGAHGGSGGPAGVGGRTGRWGFIEVELELRGKVHRKFHGVDPPISLGVVEAGTARYSGDGHLLIKNQLDFLINFTQHAALTISYLRLL